MANGEGTLHDNQKTAIDLLNFATYCSTLNVNIFLINATIVNNNTETLRKLKCFKGIYVRDKESQKILANNHILSIYCPDLVFLISNNLKTILKKIIKFY